VQLLWKARTCPTAFSATSKISYWIHHYSTQVKMNNLSKLTKSILFVTLLIGGVANAQNFTEVQKIDASDRESGDYFGVSGSISGNYAVVGAYAEGIDYSSGSGVGQVGAAYIYGRDVNGAWNDVQKIVASDRAGLDWVGISTSISGNYCIVGAKNESEDALGGNTLQNSGSAYIFERDGSGNWPQAQKIVASDRTTYGDFGGSVAISGNYAIVGSKDHALDVNGSNSMSQAGAAYLFERNGSGTWVQVQKLQAADRTINDQFGIRVAISGNYAIVSSIYEDEDANGGNTVDQAGSVYIFERAGNGTWSQVQKIVAADRATLDWFGTSLAISNDKLVVGVSQEREDANGNNTIVGAGSAYFFERNGAGIWNQVYKVVASDRDVNDQFGASVAISNNKAVIGAYSEDEDQNGNNTLAGAGSAYIFERNGVGAWSEVQKITASDRGISDEFGVAVALDGDHCLLTAYGDGEDANGGNPLAQAGSAYVFEILPCVPTTGPLQISTCDTYTVPSGDETYFSSGVYADTIINAGGCDSVLSINLTINTSTSSSTTIASCANYVWTDGNTYNATGTYSQTLTNAAGCDSVVTLNLTINTSTSSSTTITSCDNYVWTDGNTYSATGSYSQTLTNAAGCDSVAALNLTINAADATISSNDPTLTANATGATYQWLDCSTMLPLAGETSQSFTATANGSYAVIVTDGNCVDTSNCADITSIGIAESNLSAAVSVYPNPSVGEFVIDLGQRYKNAAVIITDISGKLVLTTSFYNEKLLHIALEQPKGIYIAHIMVAQQRVAIRLVLQ
jgi:hypothetical protein